MKIKKIFATLAVSAVALALAACVKPDVENTYEPESVIAVITSENGEAIVKTSEEESEAEEVETAGMEDFEGSEFVGQWECERASISVEIESIGFVVNVHWGSSAFESTVWSYNCLYDGEKLVNHGDGVKTNLTFDEEGNESDEVVYEDGAVSFTIEDGKLIWNDEKENAGEGMAFEKIPEITE